jgi:pyrophosphatase PpaX
MRFPVVLFDFDGTIVDSAAMIRASFQHVFDTIGLELDPARLPELYRLGDLETQMRAVDATRVEELARIYRVRNAELHAGLELFPGMLALLETLHGEGRRLAIVTSKRRATVELALATLPLAPFFDAIVGADDVARHKPDPLPLLHALEALGAAPAEAVYVGDAPVDVEAARAAGVHAIAVTWGGLFPVAQTLAAQPDGVAHTADELLALL